MLFGHKNRFQVDLGDLQDEKERLSGFLQSDLNATVALAESKLFVESEKTSVVELKQAVDRYVHRHNLGRTHWVSIQDKTVKINRFRGVERKKEKHAKSAPHQSMTQSWGL